MKVAVVLAFGHTLRAHEALGRPYTLSGFLEVVHRLFKDGVFVGHDQSIRAGIRSSDYCVFSRELSNQPREVSGCVPGNVLRVLWPTLRRVVRELARRYRLNTPRPTISATPRSTRAPKAR